MKLTLFLTLIATTLANASADSNSTTLLACRKKHPYIHTSYTWITIERDPIGQLTFYYGPGYDRKLLEVRFESPITRTAEDLFIHETPDSSLRVEVRGRKATFGGKNVVSGKKFECLTLNLTAE